MQQRRRRLLTKMVTPWVAVLVIAAGALVLVPVRSAFGLETLPIGGDPVVDPGDFRITVFASGLDFPYGLVELADGSILVATSNPGNSSLFASTGELVRFVDADGDGVADGPGAVLYTGLPGVVTGLAAAGGLVYVASSGGVTNRISVLRLGADPGDPLSLGGSIDLTFPDGWSHRTYGMALRPVGGGYELYFNVGAEANDVSLTATVAASGLLSAALVPESIYRVKVTDTGAAVSVGDLKLIATGLRNAVALAFHPVTGDLYFVDNGIDTPGNVKEALSVDELNVIAAADLGGAVEDFGFADSYIEYRTGTVVGGAGVPPIVVFQPWGPGALESEGAASLTFAPAAFPPGLNDGVFVGFHGKNAAGPANEENPLVYADPATGEYFHFVPTTAPGVGHLNGLLATEDSLFITDLASTGSVFSGGGSGVIYQIKAVANANPTTTTTLPSTTTSTTTTLPASTTTTSTSTTTSATTTSTSTTLPASTTTTTLPASTTTSTSLSTSTLPASTPTTLPTSTATTSPGTGGAAQSTASPPVGYRLLEADGTVYSCGSTSGVGCSRGSSGAIDFLGDGYEPGARLSPGVSAVAMDTSPSGDGYVILLSDGTVVTRGDAPDFEGSPSALVATSLPPGERVTSISMSPSGAGYWVFTNLGRVIVFGDAAHRGDLPLLAIVPEADIVASVATQAGGYYMVGADGGVFAFGGAPFLGSVPQILPGADLECPVVGLVPTLNGDGYWMVGCDGGVFAFGAAPFAGSLPGIGVFALGGPIEGMVAFGDGYLMVGADGGAFTFGTPFFGSLGATELDTPVVAIV